MGVRFRKSFKVAPGVKINLGKKGSSVSMGTKGAHVTMNTHGKTTVSTGIPGSGLSYSKSIGGSSRKTSGRKASRRDAQASGNNSGPKKPWYKRTGGKITIAVIVAIMAIYALGGGGDDSGEPASSVAVMQESTESTTIATEPSSSEAITTQAATTEATPEETTPSHISETNTQNTQEVTASIPETVAPAQTEPATEAPTPEPVAIDSGDETGEMVWITTNGKKYHSNPDCSNMKNPRQVTLDEAISSGRDACSKCY